MLSKREQNRAEQRERILDAARHLFTKRDFDEVTMAEVASQAGVARATVFNYFPSKYGLVEAITQEVYAYYCEMLETALADEQTPTPALIRGLFVEMGGLETQRTFYRGIFREFMKIQFGLDTGSPAQRSRQVAFELLERVLARGQQRGDIAGDRTAIDLAYAFDSLSNGTIVRWLYADVAGSLPESMLASAEILLSAVAVGPPTTDRH